MHKLTTTTRIVLSLGLVLAACNASVMPAPSRVANTAPTTTVQTFEGRFASAPEMSSFVPCGMNESPGPGKGYWLVPDDEFSQLYKSAVDGMIAAIAGTYGPYDKLAIYVRFEGALSPPASAESGRGYGHLGLYAREVKVTKALEARHYLLPYSPCTH